MAKRLGQGAGGLCLGRRYAAGGQALAAGLFAGVLRAGIPIWTDTSLVRLAADGRRVTGAVVESRRKTNSQSRAQRGVVLAAGGFDHHMDMRWKFQSESLGAQPESRRRDEHRRRDPPRPGSGRAIDLMDQSWWFPAVAPLPGNAPAVMLAERSLPGSLIVDQNGNRFANESCDYMSFGQRVLDRERSGNPVERHVDCLRPEVPQQLCICRRIVSADARSPRHGMTPASLIVQMVSMISPRQMSIPRQFVATMQRFNEAADAGIDSDFHRGESAYDRYYGDPTITPNPNLRPLVKGPFYAVKMVLSDLGTCGGLRADERARVLREDGSAIEGLYAIGNTAANAFGTTYPGAGATIAQGLVYGYIAAKDAAGT